MDTVKNRAKKMATNFPYENIFTFRLDTQLVKNSFDSSRNQRKCREAAVRLLEEEHTAE